MSIQIECRGCGSEFSVDEELMEKRCASCGTKHAGPWTDPEVVSSPLGPKENNPVNIGESNTVDLDDGPYSVTITIEINRN